MKKLLVSGFLIALAFISSASTIKVTNTNDTGAGSLRQAILTANTLTGADTIRFDAAINGLPIAVVANMNITGSLVIIGNGILNTKIKDNASGTVFSIGPNINVKIKYLSMTNVENGVIRYYSSGSVGNLDVVGCKIVGNGAGTGILYQCPAGSATVDSCQFSDLRNGVQIESFINATVRYCFATHCNSIGLAIYDPTTGYINLTNNTVSDSENGISLPDASSALISNNTVYNISETGIYIEMSGTVVPSMQFVNNTISNCMTGFGIYEYGTLANASALTLKNNIFYNSIYMDFDLYSNDHNGGNPSNSANIVGKTSSDYGSILWYSTSNPLLVPGGPQYNGGLTPTIAIQNGSPAINTGNAIGAPDKDQRGFSRNGSTDIGAYEFNGTVPCIISGVSVITACGSYQWINGITYTTSNNTATYTLQNMAGCDSVITLNLTILKNTSSTDVKTACGSYKWINGITYTANNNTATYTLPNKAGCDSVITLNLTILKNTSSTDVKTACGSYQWINGITYTTSNNTATYSLQNAAGCDSVVTLNLTILKNTSSTDAKTACGSFQWINGITYTTSNNTTTYTLPNAAGCDSVVTLNLTILKNTSSTDVRTACDSYQWINGITYTTSNNTAIYTLLNAAGCDSVVSLDLTINNVDTGITSAGNSFTADATDASYQWLDCNNSHSVIEGATAQTYIPSKAGNYAVEITQNTCVDTSTCLLILNVGLIESDFGSGFVLYPNPTNGCFTVDLGSDYTSVIARISDGNGRMLSALAFDGSKKLNLEIKGASGYYFVEILATDNKKAIFRILKQ